LKVAVQVGRPVRVGDIHGGDLAQQRTQHRVAILARRSDFFRADGAAAGGLIDHVDLAFDNFAQLLGEQTKQQIDTAAGIRGHDEFDGLVRKSLSKGRIADR
jgi:hypothetical protein